MSDLRFALRQLLKTPGFTLVALLTLAVGIGSATVVFSAVNAFLFKPLPLLDYAEDRLVYATQVDRTKGYDDLGWSYPDYLSVRERARTLAGIWIHHDRTVLIAGGEKPVRIHGTEITWDAFAAMGVHPIHGRALAATDNVPGAENVALISHALWTRRFQSQPDIVGSALVINGQPTTIIGVMPPEWRYPVSSDVWTPFRPDEKIQHRGFHGYGGRARLKPGVSIAEAQAELDTIMASLAEEFPATNKGKGVALRPIREEAVQETTGFTGLLFGAVMCVFLIACVNVANLLLARSATRAKEFAVRIALGATRGRVIRQLVTESVVLGLLGGAGGLVLALWGNDALKATLPIEIPFWLRFDFDLRVFGFVFALSLLAALLFGLVPALRASRPDVVSELKEGGRSVEISGPRALRLRNLLVILEIALALVLLVGAGLMMRSFIQLRRIDPGFDPRGVLSFRTGFPPAMVDDAKQVPARFFAQLLPRLASLPGVEAAALASWRPGKDDQGHVAPIIIEGQTNPPVGPADFVQHRTVTSSYFPTLRIPLKAGRRFDDAIDRADTPRVVVVDEEFARRHFGEPAAALGQRIAPDESMMPGDKPRTPVYFEIIGVVGSIRHRLDRADKHPTVYQSATQSPENFLSVILRSHTEPGAVFAQAREAVMSVNREIPIYEEATLAEILLRSDTVWPRRFFSHLFTVFGGVALFLACIGIYGVMTYNVSQRLQELGVRLALGAQPREVIHLVIRHGLRLIGCGLGVGLVAAFFLANLLTRLLYGVSPHDPPTFAIVPLFLAAVALLACWLPSRRATLIEPNAALRAE